MKLDVNAGSTEFYAATRRMNSGERMLCRAAVADPRETRSLVALVLMAHDVRQRQLEGRLEYDRK